MFTCIFAFAPDAKHEEYRTQFMHPRDRLARCWGDLHHKEADFEVATVAKYRPNNFVETRQLLHSVKRIDEELPNQRYGMRLAYYEPRHGLFHELTRPDIMADRTTKPVLNVSGVTCCSCCARSQRRPRSLR